MSENQVREVYGVGHVTIDDYAYYHTLSTEDQANLEKICVIDSSPDYIGAYYRPDGSDGLEWGMLVKADFIPKRVKKNGPKREVPDFVKCFGMAIVSEKFRQVVEALESNIHQFFPVHMHWGNGDLVEGQFYWFVVCNSLDSVNRKHTDAPPLEYGFKYFQQREGYGIWNIRKGGGEFYRIVFDLQAINGHHIWRDKYLPENPYCSDVFKRACEAAGIVGISFGSNKLEAV